MKIPTQRICGQVKRFRHFAKEKDLIGAIGGAYGQENVGGMCGSRLFDTCSFTGRFPFAEVRLRDRNYFCRQFKARMGISPEQYRIRYRVEKAKERLRQGELLESVSASVGVCNVDYLSKLFKKMAGTTPTRYRELHADPDKG